MKKQTQIKVGVVISMILLSVTVAHAQSANQRFTATIPFEFNVGEQTLPAGDYEIAIANPSSDQRVLRIRSTKGTQNVMLTTHMKQIVQNPRILSSRSKPVDDFYEITRLQPLLLCIASGLHD